MDVGHVALVLGQVGGELHVWGARLLPGAAVLLWSPALGPLLHLLFLEAVLGALPLFLPLPVALALVFPALLLLSSGSFWVFVRIDVGPRARVELLPEQKNERGQLGTETETLDAAKIVSML